MARTDAQVAVIGSGSMGSMALWRLARRGVNVVGFDSRHPGADRTAAGGDTRLFRMAYREGAAFTELLRFSEQMFHELSGEGVPAFRQYGGLSIGTSTGAYMTDLVRSVRASGVEHELIGYDDLARRWPQHALLPNDVGLFDPRGGLIRTDEAVLGAVALARNAGASVMAGTTVREIVEHPGGVEIVTDSSSVLVDQAIVTTGAWSSVLLPSVAETGAEARRVPLTWFLAARPAEFAPEVFPVFVRESGGVHMFGAPSVDGATVKVAGMFHETGSADPSHLVRSLTREEEVLAHDAVTRFFPGLMPDPVRADTYPDLYTPDMAPIVGPVAGSSRVTVATGFSGRGFKMAAGVGEILARMVLGEDVGFDLEFASPRRFGGVYAAAASS